MWKWIKSIKSIHVAIAGLAVVLIVLFFRLPWHGKEDRSNRADPGRFFGWKKDPLAVENSLKAIEKAQGRPPHFSKLFGKQIDASEDPIFLWELERKIFGSQLPAWNQGQLGSCVSHGWGRACQDLVLVQMVGMNREDWPGAQVCREAIYGGSRVQIGHQGGYDDGSVGSWAAEWVSTYGVIFYLKYPEQDMTDGKVSKTLENYSVNRCREWGNSGCPVTLEKVAKTHAVKTVAVVKSADEAWLALGNGYPIACCSDVGFQSPLSSGFCHRSGTWNHCMEFRARFTHPTKGRCFVIQNSWGDYLNSHSNPQSLVDVKDKGSVQLPDGCFAITSADANAILSQGDSFALSSFEGFPTQKLDWNDWVFKPSKDRFLVVSDRKNILEIFPWGN